MISWTVSHQAPLPMKFSRKEYWSGEDSLLRGIFQIQGSNLGLQHFRQILYHLCHQGLLKMILKGNFGFPSDVTYNWVAFNCVYEWAETGYFSFS